MISYYTITCYKNKIAKVSLYVVHAQGNMERARVNGEHKVWFGLGHYGLFFATRGLIILEPTA